MINLICDFLLLSAFVEETKEIDMELVKDALTELSFDDPVPQASGFEASVNIQQPIQNPINLDSRLARIEENYAKINADRSEKEAILERLSSQGSILEYLINQQQNQFGQLDGQLKKISAQIDRLRQKLLVDGKRSSIEESMGLTPNEDQL